MKNVLRTCIIGALLIVGHLGYAMAQSVNPPAGSPVSPADQAAIRAILNRQTDAWNKHDMDAFVAETTPDIDWINVVGRHWIGRETVMKAHAQLHKGMFANSVMRTPEVTMMREIAPNVIVETHINRIDGVGALPSGAAYPDRGNVITLVFVKTQVGWRIAHAHNTPIGYDQAKG